MDMIQMARELGAALQKTQQYNELTAAKKANDNDAKLTEQIGEFNLIKLEIQSAMSQKQPDKEKIEDKNTKLRMLYDDILKNEHMIRFHHASDELNQLMNQINTILSTAVNGGDPMTCSAQPQDCAGNCENCGGCH